MSTKARREYLRRKYQKHPELYITQVLKCRITRQQYEICRALVEHKKIIVLASHGIGKSALAAMLACWFFDCYQNSVTITTAPTKRQVDNVLWKEVRMRRKGAKAKHLYPKQSRMEVSPEWFAIGITAANPDAFQGWHSKYIFLIFDEAVGVKAGFYDSAEGVMAGDDSWFMAICNPTDPGSKIKELADSGDYFVINASALDHPNVKAALRGEKVVPIKGAVEIGYINKAIRNWCTKILATDAKSTDVEWPPGSGVYYRPGSLFEARVLGRFPSQATDNIWSEGLWLGCLEEQPAEMDQPLEVGCDVARFGPDFTSIFIRRGRTVLDWVSYNGKDTDVTSGYIVDMINRHIKPEESPQGVPIKVDDDGIGGGVVDNLRGQGYNVIRVLAAQPAFEPEMYVLRRSEMWFATSEAAAEFRIDLSRLPEECLKLLKRQLLAPKWRFDKRGRREVESKDILKKPARLGRSPDDADALNLLFAPCVAPELGRDLDAWAA